MKISNSCPMYPSQQNPTCFPICPLPRVWKVRLSDLCVHPPLVLLIAHMHLFADWVYDLFMCDGFTCGLCITVAFQPNPLCGFFISPGSSWHQQTESSDVFTALKLAMNALYTLGVILQHPSLTLWFRFLEISLNFLR